MQTVRRRNDQTAHISLQNYQCQRAQPESTNGTDRQLPSASSPDLPKIFRNSASVQSSLSRLQTVASFRHRRCFASVRRYLRRGGRTRKREKHPFGIFFILSDFSTKSWGWRNFRHKSHPLAARIHRRGPIMRGGEPIVGAVSTAASQEGTGPRPDTAAARVARP